jgi:DNA-binding NtrC family response regulator
LIGPSRRLTMRVLLIDDESMVRKIVRKMLERSGHEVTEAENGRFGLEQLKRGSFDLVITDIIMPEVEGIELVVTVSQQYPSTKTIAMSGGGRTGNVDFLDVAAKLGASAALQKPFTHAELLRAIDLSFAARQVA